MTLEVWVFPTGSLASWRAVLDKNVDGYYLMASSDPNNRPAVGGPWTGVNQTTAAPTALALNAWTHLAATFDGATVRLYVNGVQVASQAQTAPLATTTGTLQIGGDSYPNEFFAGRIDEVRIYNRALTQAEIQSDMATPVGGTPPPPDTTAPSAPTGLGATVGSTSQIDLSWTASSDNVGVTGYQVDRCQGTGCSTFAQIGTSSVTSYSDTGLAAGTTYRYRVRATDGAGNVSANSSIVTATTQTAPDTTAPSAPTGLSATATSSVQISLAWVAATDNVGVTGYQVERCQGAGCVTFAQVATPTGTSFSDSGLIAGASYSYQVRAADAAGNLSAYSNVASATTSNVPPGLVAAYAFNEGSGTTVADVSGNNNNGTISAATWTSAGKFGSALMFNGTSAQVTVPNATSLQLTTGMTLEAWVFPTAPLSIWRAEGARAERLDAPGGDLRRGDGAAVRERGAGCEPGADDAARHDHRDAANRGRQLSE